MASRKLISKDGTTEERIKAAAGKLFTQKGFAATRTRDIAEEAGINLALLNYYFRSKQKLFEIVMRENVILFIGSVIENMEQNQQLPFDKKLELLIGSYIDMLLANPDLPFFILSVSRTGHIETENDSVFEGMKQLRTAFMKEIIQNIENKKLQPIHPLHFISNMMALIVFPFAAANLLKTRTGISEAEFEKLMIERKALIPVWMKAMFETREKIIKTKKRSKK
jgi:AcrR family transcriptional regulator